MRFFFALILTLTALVAKEDLYEQGKALYFSKGCNGCHGVSAGGTTQYPPLAYRRKAFLTNKLKRYRSKIGDTQQADLMIPFAEKLTDSQIDALTTFFEAYHESKSNSKQSMERKGDGGS